MQLQITRRGPCSALLEACRADLARLQTSVWKLRRYDKGIVEDVTRQNALWRLRAMNEEQARGPEEATVVPRNAARFEGLTPGEPDYEAALQYLIDRGALREFEASRGVVGGPSQGNVAWIMTQEGLDMLEKE